MAMEISIHCTPTFFFTMFLLIYLFSCFVLFRNWGPKHRLQASSCTISLAHSTATVIMAIYAILMHSQTPSSSSSSATFASPNTTFQNTVLEFSIAYFLLDLLHNLVFFPSTTIFILHHLASLYVLSTCRYVVHHGAYAIIVILFLAEITGGCLNVWVLASLRRADSAAAAKLYDLLSPGLYYALYGVLRGIVGPLFMFKMGLFYLSGAAQEEIPRWAWVSWMIVIGKAICLSMLWVLNKYKTIYLQKEHHEIICKNS